jgi:hypothetical protein
MRAIRVWGALALALAAGCGSKSTGGHDAGATGGSAGAVGVGGRGGSAGTGGVAGDGGMAGTGGSSTAHGGNPGGAGGGAGHAGTGGGGNAGTGGGGGNAGTSAGTTGAGTGGAAGGAGTGGNAGTGGAALSVTAALDGQKYLMPCGPVQSTNWLVCQNYPAAVTNKVCPTAGPYLTKGNLMRDDSVAVGGPTGAIYDVTLRVRGVVEPKHYMNGAMGTPANGTNYGWYVGGEPSTAGDYSKLMLWVSAPVVMQTGTLDGQYYFLNAIEHNEAHFSYPVDYAVTFPVAAGATLRFLADDSNCSMIKNCDDTSVDQVIDPPAKCNPSTIADLPAGAGIAQPYPGQFIYLTVVSAVMR